MNAARSQPQRREQMVDLFDGAAADERQCAGEFAFGARQRCNKACGRHDFLGARRQIEQRAIDIEKKSERGIAQSRHITSPRALNAWRVQFIHPQLLTPLRPTYAGFWATKW